MLGKGHAALLRRAELKTFVDFHGNEVLSQPHVCEILRIGLFFFFLVE